ncbi:MAG: cobyrinate a,c-diamide synthase [Oscillospiraceae bacterium]|nr:cobyrinate a,c-diamide synthase [Oscillospiraceae bacterium]
MKRLLIAGTGSGCGKTTVTCAVLKALTDRGLLVNSFKCGPDYLDTMMHDRIISGSARNLDSFFCNADTLCYLLDKTCDIAVIEGVMGFYDGSEGSAYSVSEITETPVILVIDCKGMSDSIGAIMQGFLNFRTPNRIAGFIFNRLSEKLIPLAKHLCDELHTEYFGCFPKNSVTLESRHLGLVTAQEIQDFDNKMHLLGELAENYLCLEKMLSLPDLPVPACQKPILPELHVSPVIAIAKDRAFCFLYRENLELLENLGCQIKYFSPLEDEKIPEDADGLILCGGYPELYAEQLSENISMLTDIRQKIKSGLPCIAECGGFLYLHENLKNPEGNSFPMAGIFQGEAYRTDKLRRFGYLSMTAEQDNLLYKKGETLKAHEFHYWESPDCGTAFTAHKKDGRSWKCCHVSDSLYAGFPHLYFYANLEIAVRFVQKCAEYQSERRESQ